jgi:BirA family biotin operon repressor/biotin-[acetyl-CoA-carboxylase] ligase
MATLFVGQNKVYLPATDSTNSYAIGLLKNVNTPEGTVVYTDHQTNGRGQRGSTWMADSAMNLTISLILKPQFLTALNSFYLSKITALALYDVLAEITTLSQFDIKIKWPNDILVNKQKIAGILIENSFKDETVQWSVIGIGLNVNQAMFDGPFTATSLKLLTGSEFNRDEVMQRIFIFLEKWYLALRSGKLELIDSAYTDRLLGFNNVMDYESGLEKFRARIKGVDAQGFLELELDDKSKRKFDFKEVKLLLNP